MCKCSIYYIAYIYIMSANNSAPTTREHSRETDTHTDRDEIRGGGVFGCAAQSGGSTERRFASSHRSFRSLFANYRFFSLKTFKKCIISSIFVQ